MGQDNISDDKGAEPVEGTCVFYFIYLLMHNVWCVNNMSPTLLNTVSVSHFF